MSKKFIKDIEATPRKRLYYSIIVDYDLNRAICELIDNALDIWVKNSRVNPVRVEIEIDPSKQIIRVLDNAGGVPETRLSDMVAPGQTSNEPTDETIGIFGVGTKRAVVALAKYVKITTRYKKHKTFQIEFDDSWLKTDEWILPEYEVDDISEGATIIELQNLRIHISDDSITKLKEHLQATYAKFLLKSEVSIVINSEQLTPLQFEDWAYPPSFQPQRINSSLTIKQKGIIKVEILAGLTKVSSPVAGEYGVYIYCNDRLIGRGLKSFDVGFTKGLAGKPHPNASLMRVIMSLTGPALLMPWNSSKSDINPNHSVFIELRIFLVEVVKYYASLSRRLEGRWPEQVFRYTKGTIIEKKIENLGEVKRFDAPELPKSKLRYGDIISQGNRTLAKQKPWIVGLYEGIIAVDLIHHQALKRKNRIILILLDSTLEIAFKEYLVNESGKHYSQRNLLDLFKHRHLVEAEIKKYVTIDEKLWKKVRYYYDLRCNLIHERATPEVPDGEIEDYRKIVQQFLIKLFNLRFSKT